MRCWTVLRGRLPLVTVLTSPSLSLLSSRPNIPGVSLSQQQSSDDDEDGLMARAMKLARRSIVFDTLFDDASASIYEVVESCTPVKVGYGFVMGYSSGFCLKRVSKFAAFTVGGCFICLQTLSYHGYIVVNHQQLKEDFEIIFDLDKDGDIDKDDAKVLFDKPPVPDPYSPPPGTPTCQYQNQTAPYYYHVDCTQDSLTQHCSWSYDLDCRSNPSCPWSYSIDCEQLSSGQKCDWHYNMDCTSTVPAPTTCPWDYTIKCV